MLKTFKIMSNVEIFIYYRVISRLYFHLPVIFLIFWSLRIDYISIMLITATYGLSSNLAMIIIKYISNIFTPKIIIIIGELLKALGLFLVFLGIYPGDVSLTSIIVGQIFGGIGFSISLSADSGLIKQITKEKPNDFLRIQSKTQSLMFMATLIAGFIGGVLFQYNISWPLIAGIFVSIISIVFINLINSENDIDNNKSYQNDYLEKISKDTKKWIYYYAAFRAFALAPFVGLLPLFFSIRNLDPYLFGFVLGLFTLGGFIFSLYGFKVINNINEKYLFLIISLMISISFSLFILDEYFLTMGYNSFILSLFGIFILGLSSGAIRPVIVPRINIDNLNKVEQIMVFSYMEKLFGYLNAVFLVFIGIVSTYLDINYTFIAIIISILCIVIFEY